MARKKDSPDEHAISFLSFARQYKNAANLLHESDQTLSYPTYFLYSHAVELLLKAFLRAHDVPIRRDHLTTELYEKCRDLGLRIGPDDRFDIRNVVALLEDANDEQGLRYFSPKLKPIRSAVPDLSWTRDIVEKLLQTVEPIVYKKAEADGIKLGVVADFILAISKPTKA